MKVIFYKTLLFALIVSMTACKSRGDKGLRKFYNDINRQTRVDNYLVDENTKTPGVMKKPQMPVANSQKTDYSKEATYMEIVRAKSNEYQVKYDNSEITNSDVYLEAARNRKAMMQNAQKEAAVIAKTTTTTTKVEVKGESQSLSDQDKKLIRELNVTLVNKADEVRMKTYSVVIGTFSMKASIDRLAKAFAGSNENLIFVKNNVGLYYAIAETYDSDVKAVERLKEIEIEYKSRYTTTQLHKKYGIPFTDLWILKR